MQWRIGIKLRPSDLVTPAVLPPAQTVALQLPPQRVGGQGLSPQEAGREMEPRGRQRDNEWGSDPAPPRMPHMSPHSLQGLSLHPTRRAGWGWGRPGGRSAMPGLSVLSEP